MTVDEADEPAFLSEALRMLAAGATTQELGAHLAEHHGGQIASGAAPDEARRVGVAIARELWRLTPDPADGWRQRALPRVGRNDPCYCGSGRKFKQCCEPLASSMPKLAMEPHDMAGWLFVEGPPTWRKPEALRRMLGVMLGAAAHAWGEVKGPQALVDLVEPVFLEPAALGEAHEPVLDLLLDAMLECGLEERRTVLLDAIVGKAKSRSLRCTALARRALMASDRGDHAAAWESFRAAQRELPDDPQLLHLEMLLLLTEGREHEARLRGPLLAAKARKLGYDELSGMLLRLAEEGLAAVQDLEDVDEAEVADWIALLREPLPRLAPAAFTQLHRITEQGGELAINPTPATRRKIKPWSARFEVESPILTGFHANADGLLDGAPQARDWLRDNPALAAAVPVLDDLLVAARAMQDETTAVEGAAFDLAGAAADMIVTALEQWPEALLSWSDHDNRPTLRIVAQAIDLALQAGRDEQAMAWMRWALRRNPEDRHGWREVLRWMLLRAGDAQGALAVLDAYPQDMVPAKHDRAFALYLLGRRDEAAAILREVHAAQPEFVKALLPQALDRPADYHDHFFSYGGADHAWNWRQEVREAWARSGALDWLVSLQLPDPSPAPGRAKGRRKAEPPAAPRALGSADPDPLLRAQYGERFPWVLGWLSAMAWAPGLVMPTQWIGDVIGPDAGIAPGDLESTMHAVFDLYNRLNEQRLQGEPHVPLPRSIGRAEDEGWASFAAGFVRAAEKHGRAAWRPVATVSARDPLFGPLYQLAAMAAPGNDGWRASTDASAPLLSVAGVRDAGHDLAEKALQPLWKAAIAKTA